MAYAFRCKKCGYLESLGYAGECDCPVACRVCNGGVSFDPTTGKKNIHPENWEHLADCDAKRLSELGINPDDVEKHTPAISQASRPAEMLERSASDATMTKDRGG